MPPVPSSLHCCFRYPLWPIPQAVADGSFEGLQFDESVNPLTHLADDVLVFGTASAANIQVIREIFNRYCQWSGQASNLAKSSLVLSKKITPATKEFLQAFLEMEASKELGLYLGVPLTDGIPRLYHFDPVKISAKLEAWRGKTLSMAGRITLINYSLLPVLFYTLAHSRVPRRLMAWINLQLSAFLWNHSPEERHGHYIGWESFILNREQGGAGIRNLDRWHEALSRRNAIKVITEPDNFWVTQVRAKYNFRSWWHPSRKSNISSYCKMLRLFF